MRMDRKWSKEKIDKITNDFYSRFCDTDIAALEPGVHLICSRKREQEVRGFGCRYSIYALLLPEKCIVAYAPKYREFFSHKKWKNSQELIEDMESEFRLSKNQLMIFEEERIQDFAHARILTEEDYPLYEEFFVSTNPGCDPSDWLNDYFMEKARKEFFTGYIKDGKLICVCDAPDMPHGEGAIQHTGICTLESERRKGYAAYTAGLATHHLLELGICPQWECPTWNQASVALAKAIGHKEYGIAYILEE